MKNKSLKNEMFYIIIGVLLFLYITSMLFAFSWGILNTLKDYEEFILNPLAFPKKIVFGNWIDTFNNFAITYTKHGQESIIYIEGMFFNSVLYSVGCALVQAGVACVVAYLASKYNFKFSKVIYGIVIVTMILPIVGALPSEIQMATRLGLYDTLFGILIMKMNFLGINFLIFYSSFKGISWEFAESAFVDGASHLMVMLKIMMPLIKTTFLAIFILNFINYWNDYQVPMIYLPSMPTAAYGLFYMKFYSTQDFGKAPMQLTGCIMLSLPCVVLFAIFQKSLMGNLTVGGVKG